MTKLTEEELGRPRGVEATRGQETSEDAAHRQWDALLARSAQDQGEAAGYRQPSTLTPERSEKVCDACGGHNPVWYAPNPIWNLAVGGPEAKYDPGGFLCPVCFIARAESSGLVPTAWLLRPETESDYPSPPSPEGAHHKLDTETQVFFYEQDFYVLSNFSAFELVWKGVHFGTSEVAYHWEKFANPQTTNRTTIAKMILAAKSAHDAFKIAEKYRDARREDWDNVKVAIMRNILRAKVDQHEYVRRKLIATGDRELIEDSWRDDFWGCGPNRDGQNMLGKLWMEIRIELRSKTDV